MWVCGGLSTSLFLAGLAVPGRLSWLYRAWMGIALLISKVTTPIFMGIIYFLVLTPIGFLRRTLGKSPLRRDPESDTYWVPRSDGGSRTDMHRQF